ncbi:MULTISPECIES: sterol desaturase family protein [unclassified Pseudomonas]|uniref:sterol desaturase family protein n=1 Tax=unclassified Pseudomonas TaxID=196821 RepID=UPI000D34146C|nr:MULTISPECIES: sterol desaturase family protein [unclassified Pseudomonas]RAU44551.1 beta-carotene hydroxylase [Pseudomonas sp. RIT 409]RAU55012.1 beta-carotene hydroxylase [Pseudomonas sp. RIT 412]
MIFNFAIFLCTLIAMEGVGFLAHKYVMHGWGWFLHRSHHEEHLGAFETNDVYLLVLVVVAVGLIVLGHNGHDPLQWVGAGVAAFALIYILVHDGIVHRHWPLRPQPRNRYLRRLYQAHLMHHAVKGRRNSVSFGFLYAPPVATLQRQLREMRRKEPAPTGERTDRRGTPIHLFIASGDSRDAIESTTGNR